MREFLRDKMNIQAIIEQMIVIFLVISLGFIAHKIKLFPRIFSKRLASLVVNICLPALIFSSVSDPQSLPESSSIFPLLVLSFLSYALVSILAYGLTHLLPFPQKEESIYRFMLIFGNVGFIGYPVVSAIFGPQAVFYACVLNMPNALFVFTLGIHLITKGSASHHFRVWDILSPSMMASLFSILIVLFRWEMPSILQQSFGLVGGITVPASLMIIGSSLAQIPAKDMTGTPPIFMMCILRLLIIPYVLLFLGNFLPFSPVYSQVNAIVMGMPVATFGTMFCLQYGVNEKTMTQGTFLSTLLSLLSIPLLVYLF